MECTLYDTLGISRHASAAEIKRAFKQKALECHPDKKGPEGEDEFKTINAAFHVLGDPTRKLEYDKKLHVGLHANSGRGAARPRSGFTMDKTAEKDLDDCIIRERSDFKQRNACLGRTDFASWYHMKTKEFDDVEEAARKQNEEKRQEQHRQQQLEEQQAKAQAALGRQKFQQEQRRLAQEIFDEQNRQAEARRAEEQRLLKEAEQRRAAELQRQAEASVKVESYMSDLAAQREDLKAQRAKLAAEASACRVDSSTKAKLEEERMNQLLQDQMAVNSRLEEIKRKAEEEILLEQQKEAQAELQRQLEAQKELQRKRQQQEEDEENERQAREWKERRRKQVQELEAQCKAYMREIQEQKVQHQEELELMRKESALAEAEARAAIETLRKAKGATSPSSTAVTSPVSPEPVPEAAAVAS